MCARKRNTRLMSGHPSLLSTVLILFLKVPSTNNHPPLSALSSKRTERTDFGFVGKAGNQPLPHLQPAAFAARPDLGIEAGLDCISYAHFSPLLCIIQLHFLTVLHNCISVLDCISYGHFSKMPSHRTVTRSRHLPIFNFTPTPPPL